MNDVKQLKELAETWISYGKREILATDTGASLAEFVEHIERLDTIFRENTRKLNRIQEVIRWAGPDAIDNSRVLQAIDEILKQ